VWYSITKVGCIFLSGGPGPRTVEFTTGRTSCSDPTNYLKVFNFPKVNKM